MKCSRRLLLLAASVLFSPAVFSVAARSQDENCVKCHETLVKKRVVHGGLQGGCTTCHTAIDASTTPCRTTGRIAKGLSSSVPALCYKCHGRKTFEGKMIHAPVAEANCALCHHFHASQEAGLLKKNPVAVCLGCHAEVKNSPHVISAGHPVGGERRMVLVEDPLRAGKQFYCGACHEPHRSERNSLMRFDPNVPKDFCQKCHKF